VKDAAVLPAWIAWSLRLFPKGVREPSAASLKYYSKATALIATLPDSPESEQTATAPTNPEKHCPHAICVLTANLEIDSARAEIASYT